MRIVDLDLDLTHENARDFGLNNFYQSQHWDSPGFYEDKSCHRR